MKKKKENRKYTIITIVSFLVFLLIWELLVDVFQVIPEKKLVSPATIVETFIYKLSNKNPDGSVLMVHILTSLQESVLGFLIGIGLGIPIGICMAWFKRFDQFFKPIFDLIKPIPPVGWVPIMIMAFGIGLMSKVTVIAFAAFIPAVINSYSGIKQMNPVHMWVAQTFGGSRMQILRTVAIPTAGPMIFAGIKVSLNASWVTLVAAELVASTAGLGYMIQMARMVGRIDIVFMGVLVIGAFGALFAFLLNLVEKKLVKGGRS
ncbi:MAG: ABC transporter permease [Eubacteriales bacterium]